MSNENKFRSFKPASLRLWHWLNALAILGLLGTVLLRKTLLSWRANSALISSKLEQAGAPISPDLAKEIAVSIRNPLWDWHIYLGFALAILFLARIFIACFVEKKIPGMSSLSQILKSKKKDSAFDWHYHLVHVGYAALYLVTLLMIVTGLLLVYKDNIALSKNFSGLMKEVHEIMMWFFVAFTVGHIGGVVLIETKKEPGLVSDMISGGNQQNK